MKVENRRLVWLIQASQKSGNFNDETESVSFEKKDRYDHGSRMLLRS